MEAASVACGVSTSDVTRRVQSICAALRPLDSLREAYEWTRALAYTGVVDGDESAALAGALPLLAAPVRAGSLVDQIAGRDFIVAIEALAIAAGYTSLKDAAQLQARLSPPVASDWAALASRPHDIQPVIPRAAYESLLFEAYALPDSLESMRVRLGAVLDSEVAQLRSRCEIAGRRLEGRPALPEDVMRALGRERSPAEDALTVARRMVSRALPDLERAFGPLSPAERALTPSATPPAAEALGTEGEAFAANVLGSSPLVQCWVTPSKCGSVYSLANVVFHELLHAWHMHRAATAPGLKPLQRVVTPWAGLLVEGLATRRERELFELFQAGQADKPVHSLFAEIDVEFDVALAEFDVDTRYWWVIRLVRGLFELEVQAGRMGYCEFVTAAAARTDLSPERVHGACFPFFERPGSALTYAIGRIWVDDLARLATNQGISSSMFGERALSMGMLPPAEWPRAVLAPAATSSA